MAAKTFFLVNGVDGNGWQALSESAQSAVDCAAGWVVGTGSTNHSELAANSERASSTFTGTTVPDGSLDTSLKDAFRTPSALSGQFVSGNWTFQFAMRSPTQGGAADGRVRFRIIKANADGSSPTEITAGQQQASLASNVGSAADVNSSLTVNPGAITLANQYLFVQVAWERTGAGGMSTTNMRFRTGSAATPTGTVIVSSDWVPDLNGSLSQTLGSLTSTSTGTVAVAGSLSKTLGALTSDADGAVAVVGTTSKTLDTLTVDADGTVATAGVNGAVNQTLGALTASSSGTVAVTGGVSKTLGSLTADADGSIAVSGALSKTLAALGLSASGTVAVAGSVSKTLGAVTVDGDGSVSINGSLSSTLAALGLAANGTTGSGISGSVTQTLASLTVDADGYISAGSVVTTRYFLLLALTNHVAPVTITPDVVVFSGVSAPGLFAGVDPQRGTLAGVDS